MRISRCLSSDAGVRLMCLFAFEFISCYCTVICAPAGEGVTDAALGLPAGQSEGASECRPVVLFLPSHLCAALQGSAYFTHLQTQPLCLQDGAPSGPIRSRVLDVKDASVYMCVRKRWDRRLSFVSLLQKANCQST